MPDLPIDKTAAQVNCRGCGHPVSHHRTGERNQYNAYQSRCAYRQNPSDAECPCQLHRAAARPPDLCGWCQEELYRSHPQRLCNVRRDPSNRNQHLECRNNERPQQ